MTDRSAGADAFVDDRPAQHTVAMPAAVELLCNLKALRVLMAFLHRPYTLSGAAIALERPVSSVAYWVPKFERCGLIERHREIKRAGTTIIEWQTPARQLVVRANDLPFDARIRFMDSARYRMLRRFLDGVDEVIAEEGMTRLGFDARTEPTSMTVDIVEDDEQRRTRSYTDFWAVLSLDDADAREFSAELEVLLRRYSQRSGMREYVVHGGLVPTPKVKWRSAVDEPIQRRA